jgi:hypothetical protein
VFLVTADQAASFDSESIIGIPEQNDPLYIGNEANCGDDGANSTGCPSLGADSGVMSSITGYVNDNLPPVYQAHPLLFVFTTEMPEQYTTGGQMIVVYNNGTTNSNQFQLTSDGQQQLPIIWSAP